MTKELIAKFKFWFSDIPTAELLNPSLIYEQKESFVYVYKEVV